MLAELPCLRVTTYPWGAVLPSVPGSTEHDLKEGKVHPKHPPSAGLSPGPFPILVRITTPATLLASVIIFPFCR